MKLLGTCRKHLIRKMTCERLTIKRVMPSIYVYGSQVGISRGSVGIGRSEVGTDQYKSGLSLHKSGLSLHKSGLIVTSRC